MAGGAGRREGLPQDLRPRLNAQATNSRSRQTYKLYINPPLVTYEKEACRQAAAVKPKSNDSEDRTMFAYLLIGFSAMFLLFIAGSAMSDLYRELRQHTFERYQTLRDSLTPFLASKAVFAVVHVAVVQRDDAGRRRLDFSHSLAATPAADRAHLWLRLFHGGFVRGVGRAHAG